MWGGWIKKGKKKVNGWNIPEIPEGPSTARVHGFLATSSAIYWNHVFLPTEPAPAEMRGLL